MKKTIFPDKSEEYDGINYFDFVKEKITIISFRKPFEFVYVPQDVLPINVIGEKDGFSVVMNGSFFDGTRLDAKHAGWLKIMGKNIAPLKKDDQLTHIVAYSPINGKMEFINYNKFIPNSNKDKIEFQAGPVIISNNQITKDFIKSSINGMREHIRTLIGYSSDNLIYFIIIRQKLTLFAISEKLLYLEPFKNKLISIINLDGEPSTALWTKFFPDFNYNENERLPLLLAVR